MTPEQRRAEALYRELFGDRQQRELQRKQRREAEEKARREGKPPTQSTFL